MLHFILSLWIAVISIFHNQPSRHAAVKAAAIVVSPSPTITLTLTPTPAPTKEVVYKSVSPIPTPLEDCIGPDGKHLKLSLTDCNKFNAAWGSSPTATPQPQTSTTGNTSIYNNSNTPTQNSSTVMQDAQAILQAKQNQYNTCASVASSGLNVCDVGCGVVHGQVVVVYPNAQDCLNSCSAQYQSALNTCVAQSRIQ